MNHFLELVSSRRAHMSSGNFMRSTLESICVGPQVHESNADKAYIGSICKGFFDKLLCSSIEFLLGQY